VPAAGSRSIVQDIDLRPSRNVIVRLLGWVDETGQVIRWRFLSLDPLSGEPVDDPMGGFLPPNAAPPEGQGSVSFSCVLKNAIASGARVINAADIVFDANPSLRTPTWVNVIDSEPPTSQVAILDSIQESARFPVEWAGSDPTSGVAGFNVLVSDSGGPYQAWRSRTTAVRDTFEGVMGHTYAFYSIAVDSAGNIESAPSVPDATTRVDTDTAVLVSLVGWTATADSVRLEWYVAGEASSVEVESQAGEDAWRSRGPAESTGNRHYVFIDTDIVPGGRYGYRLALGQGQDEITAGEVWVEVPQSYWLAIEPVSNPVLGSLDVNVTLTGHHPASIDVFDVAGRRVRSFSLAEAQGGRHRVRVERGERLQSGVYMVRVREGRDTRQARVVLIR